MGSKTKKCIACKKRKNVTEFYNRTSAEDGKQPKCKECDKAYRRYYNHTNPLFATFHTILCRCNNPNTDAYPHYGGKGIKCLFKNYKQFYTHARPLYEEALIAYKGQKIECDRIKTSGNYEVGNIRFVPRLINIRNGKSNNRPVKINGVQYSTISEASEAYGISVDVIQSRLRRGWTMKRAVTVPVSLRKQGRKVRYEGVEYVSHRHLAESYNMKYNRLMLRLYNGWSLKKAMTTPALK